MTHSLRSYNRDPMNLRAGLFFASVLVFIAACLTAAQGATITTSSAEVTPGEHFTLTLRIDAPPPYIGASFYLKTLGTFQIIDRDMIFTDPTVTNGNLTSISEVRSQDLAGLVDFDAPITRTEDAITLTLEAPAMLGIHIFYVDTASILLFPDFSTAPLTTNPVSINIVPEPPTIFLLLMLGFVRLRWKQH